MDGTVIEMNVTVGPESHRPVGVAWSVENVADRLFSANFPMHEPFGSG